MSLSITILGCGSSGGVPRPAAGWGECDPNEPKNRRRRCSILVQRRSGTAKTNVIVDTSPDLREQLLSADLKHIDSVLFTHDHADHTHGIDDVRAVVIEMRRILPVYSDARTAKILRDRFGYCFESPPGSDYPPIVRDFRLVEGYETEIEGAGGSIRAVPFEVQHGDIMALGLQFGRVAYTPDVNDVPSKSLKYLENLDIWIIDALRRRTHPTHFNLAESLEWIARMKPKRAILTNMHNDLDYATLCKELPENVVPAYDGMVIEIPNQ